MTVPAIVVHDDGRVEGLDPRLDETNAGICARCGHLVAWSQAWRLEMQITAYPLSARPDTPEPTGVVLTPLHRGCLDRLSPGGGQVLRIG